jgi:hypothetical protein
MAVWCDGGLLVPGLRLRFGGGVRRVAGAGFGDDLVA